MFGKLRRDKTAAPVQGATLAASAQASIDPHKLILVHSRDQGSTPARKALMARAMASPPTHTNSILANGLTRQRGAEFTNSTASLAKAAPQSVPVIAEPAKGEVAWDTTNLR